MNDNDALNSQAEDDRGGDGESRTDLVLANAALLAEIAERQKVEKELRESEARYRQLLLHAPAGIYELDLTEGKFTAVNDVMCEYTGYTREEFLSLNPMDVLSQDSQRRFLERQIKIAAGESVPANIEYQIKTKQGREFWVLLNSRFSHEGDRTRAAVVVHDITERKQAAMALAESEEKYRRVVENANEAIVVAQDDRLKFFNSKTMELTGFSEAELSTTPFAQLIHPEDQGLVMERHIKRLQGEQLADSYNFRVIDRRGDVRWTEIRSVLIEWDGRPAALALLNEITERKRSEQLLQVLDQAALAMGKAFTREEVFGAVATELRNMGLANTIYLTDKGRKRLTYGYGSYESRTVRTAERVAGFRFREQSFAIDDVDMFREVVRERKTVFADSARVMSQAFSQRAGRFAGRLATQVGLSKSIAAPLIVQDQVEGLLLVHSDHLVESDLPTITAFAHQVASAWRKAQLIEDLEKSLDELKRAQSQLVQAQKLEAVGRLAGGVAHDFNNLLTVIQVNAQLLLRSLHASDPLREHVVQIEEAGIRAARLTKQLLRFSRREIAEPQILDLNQIAVDLNRMLRRVIGEDIDLLWTYDDDLWLIQADPSQIEQVIVNLTLNARDAMPSGGRLSIETANVVLHNPIAAHPANVPPGEYVVLTFGDSGVGMDREIQSRIFEPFFTTKEQGRGTGLGLSTVYGVVTQNKGYVSVSSQVGQGTTFQIYLPRVKADRPSNVIPASDKVSGAMPGGSQTVLVVEDEHAVRELTAQVLQEHGYKVLTAENGANALQLSLGYQGSIDLLVTDVVMPGMSGWELAEGFRKQRPGARVLFTSGYSDRVLAEQRVSADAFDFIPKPFTLEALTHKVQTVLQSPRAG